MGETKSGVQFLTHFKWIHVPGSEDGEGGDGDLKEDHLLSLIIMFFGVKDHEWYEERLLQVNGTAKYDKGDTANASSEQ
ncbi:hypothetical protein Tco_1280028, partial [Tanacetum coccineum]